MTNEQEYLDSPAPEPAHVPFMDNVGYSKLPMEGQLYLIRNSQEMARATPSLPTGDGIKLVFSDMASLRMAWEIDRAAGRGDIFNEL